MKDRQSNPTMRADLFEALHAADDANAMTLRGTANKLLILLAIAFASAAIGWVFPIIPIALTWFLAGLGIAIYLCFNPSKAPVFAPIYAVGSGYVTGMISAFTTESLKDSAIGSAAVPLALMGTMFTLLGMLFLYAKRIIRVTETMRSIIFGLTAGVALTYLACMVIWLFAPNFVNNLATFGNGPIGIGFSLFVIGLAAFNFLLDFDLIERGIQSKAPKYMEWYAAFGTLVTIIWLYLEILRLIRKLSR